MSEVVCYPQGFCLSGGFGSKKSGMSFCMELSLCPAPGNILSMQQSHGGTRTDAAFSGESWILAWGLFWRWTQNWPGEGWGGNVRGNAGFL